MDKKILKKLAVLTMAVCMMTGVSVITASAADISAAAYVSAAVSGDFSTSVNRDGTITIVKYNGSDTNIKIPSAINGVNVTVIGSQAFSGRRNITDITIPSSVTTIEADAFNGCSSIKMLFIPKNVKSIDSSAFMGCTSLFAVNVSAANPSFSSENGVLFNKNKTVLVAYPAGRSGIYTVPSTVDTIGDKAFSENSSLESVTIPDSVKTIGYNAFDYCTNLRKVRMSSTLTALKTGAFNGCRSLTSITLPDTLTVLERNAFSGCRSLRSIIIPKKITFLDFSLFEGCTSLRYIYLPNGLKNIYPSVFDRCTSLVSVRLPYTLEKVYSLAFNGCSQLKNMTVAGKTTVLDTLAFNGCGSMTIYGKSGSAAEKRAGQLGIPFSAKAAPALSLSDITSKGRVISVKAKAVDGKAPYYYSVLYRADGDQKFTSVQSFSSNTAIKFKVPKSGSYTIRVKVKDSSSRITYTDQKVYCA